MRLVAGGNAPGILDRPGLADTGGICPGTLGALWEDTRRVGGGTGPGMPFNVPETGGMFPDMLGTLAEIRFATGGILPEIRFATGGIPDGMRVATGGTALDMRLPMGWTHVFRATLCMLFTPYRGVLGSPESAFTSAETAFVDPDIPDDSAAPRLDWLWPPDDSDSSDFRSCMRSFEID